MPRGENLHPMFRSSDKRYTARPPANCRSARDAWDSLSDPARGAITCLWLDDGYWMAIFADGSNDDRENTFGVNREIRKRKAARAAIARATGASS